jgi:RIO kinase 1
MRMPEALSSLVDEGIIEEILRPLMSGKEAQIYLVVADGKQCVAKIYKEAQNRTFKHRADYTEGRKVRNSRDQRAIDKRSKHGRGQDEAAWRSTEVDMIYRLQAAGVRVPAPYHFIDGVLVMELVTGENGEPAPRLGEVDFSPEQATLVHERLLREVVRMLCAGVVHGDLSDFNVLMGTDGPVIIDLPQAVDPSKNQNARKLLLRDVDNLQRFLGKFVPSARRAPFAEEMWALFENNQLTPETVLRGQYRPSQKKADTGALLELIGEVNEDERRRRAATEPQSGRRPRRVEINVESVPNRRPAANGRHSPAAPATATAAATNGARHSPAPRPQHPAPRPQHPAPRPQHPAPHSGASHHANAHAAPRSGAPAPAARPPRPAPQGGHHAHAPAAPRDAATALPARAPRPVPQPGASQHATAPAASHPVDGATSPPARRRRRRRSRSGAGVPREPAAANGGNAGQRAARPEQTRPPHPPAASQRPAAEGNGAGGQQEPQRQRSRNPQRPVGPR